MRGAIKIIGCLLLGGMIISCKTDKKADQPEAQAEMKPVKECFQYTVNKDTVSLSIDMVDNKVTGLLMYNLYEKDKSQGTIVGEIKGDTLVADYTFNAEGVTSMSEVVFLKRNNQLIQGFGETTTSEGKEVFKSRNTLSFDDSLVLSATECEKK